MFCPSCGTEYTIELKYCNRCGANLSSGFEAEYPAAPVSIAKPAFVIGAVMTILTVLGFGLLMTGAIELSHNPRIDADSITAIVIVGMLTILTLDIFLVRQLSRIISASLSSGTQTRKQRPKALTNSTPLPMPSMPQPPTGRLQGVRSVTEGTTRFFEPYRAPADPIDRPTVEKHAPKIDN
jgi:hypothetical protein